MELIEVEPITPERHRLGERPPSEQQKARLRLVIESVFANLKQPLGDPLDEAGNGLGEWSVSRI